MRHSQHEWLSTRKQNIKVRVVSLGDVGVEALGHILLGALLLSPLLQVLSLLLPCHTDHTVSLLHAPAEVYRGVLRRKFASQ